MPSHPTTQLPDGWRAVRLGEVADVAFSSVDKKTVEGEVPVQLCNYTDVFYNRRILPDMPFMAATASPAECDRWALRKGDVLFTKDSETADEIGIPSYIAEDMPNVLCGYHLGLARPASDSVNGAFLTRALGSHATAREFSRIANGITRFGLTLDATRSLPLLLPPLAEQRAIAAVLDAIDEAIERTEAIVAATERLRDALLHELLTRGLPGRHTSWREVAGLGTLPAGWEVVRLGDVAEVVMGQSPPGKTVTDWDGEVRQPQGLPFLQGNAEFGDRFPQPAKWCAKPHKVAEPGDTLISVRAPVGDTNRCDQRTAIGRGLAAIRFTVATPSWGWHIINHVKREFDRVAQGSTFEAVGGHDLRTLRLPLPPLAEQQAIAETLDSADASIEGARSETDVLQSVKAATADALLTGRVRVAGGA